MSKKKEQAQAAQAKALLSTNDKMYWEVKSLADSIQNLVTELQQARNKAEEAGLDPLAAELHEAVGEVGSGFSRLLSLT